MHKHDIVTRSQLLDLAGLQTNGNPGIAEVDNALHQKGLMRLDACFPLADETIVITITPGRMEDYRLVLPLLAIRRVVHRIALMGDFEPQPIKTHDLAEIDRELLTLQEQNIDLLSVYPVYQVYAFDRSNLISAVRINLPQEGSVAHLTMWTAEYLTGISVDELKPPATSLENTANEGISGLVAQGLDKDDATLLYWLHANPEASVSDASRLGDYLGITQPLERINAVLSQY